MRKANLRNVTALACAIVVSAVAVMVLVGWQTHNLRLMCVVPGFITMKANTAFAFLACGIALLSIRSHQRFLAPSMAVLPGVIGLATLLEYGGIRFNIDEILFRDPYSAQFSGRMAHISAINFVILSLGLFLLARGKRNASQLCFAIVGFGALFAVLGYAYGVPLLYGSVRYTAMALHTGASFLILAIGGLAASSEGGVLAIIWVEDAGSHLVRRLFPASLFVPAVIGVVVLRNPLIMIDPRLAAALIVLFNILLFSAMVLSTSLTLHKMQSEKEAAEHLSQIDPLTGLLNRRALERALDLEFERWERFRAPFSVLMIDIDRFKSINDQYGHLMGDVVLQKLSAAWAKQTRGVDLLARFGGEEFVLVALGTTSQSAFTVAEKIRATTLEISNVEFGFKVTVSCGIATVGMNGASRQDLLRQADAAGYEAKAAGRNCTKIARAEAPAKSPQPSTKPSAAAKMTLQEGLADSLDASCKNINEAAKTGKVIN